MTTPPPEAARDSVPEQAVRRPPCTVTVPRLGGLERRRVLSQVFGVRSHDSTVRTFLPRSTSSARHLREGRRTVIKGSRQRHPSVGGNMVSRAGGWQADRPPRCDPLRARLRMDTSQPAPPWGCRCRAMTSRSTPSLSSPNRGLRFLRCADGGQARGQLGLARVPTGTVRNFV